MPKDSEKFKLLKGVCLQHVLNLNDVDSDSDLEDELMVDFTINAALILTNRRSTHFELPKSIYWAEEVLPYFDEGRMRQMLRVSSYEFSHILCLIEKDPVFNTEGVAPQIPIHLQLQIALFRFGANGDNASVRKVATLFGVGDGGTVLIVTKRVIRAFLNLKSKYLFWPKADERKKIIAETMHELPGCIGYIDGSEIRLAEAPAVNHEVYYSRKKQYSIKIQLVCDHRLVIRHAVIGHQGSVHDARMFAQSSLGQAPEQFFSEKEYVAGDSAYPLSRNVITPFRQNSREFTEELRTKFNVHFSKYRVRIENCFGKLKEICGSLKQLRFRLHNEDNHKDCCNWILACCILHNILIDINRSKDLYMPANAEFPTGMHTTNDIRAFLVNYVSHNF